MGVDVSFASSSANSFNTHLPTEHCRQHPDPAGFKTDSGRRLQPRLVAPRAAWPIAQYGDLIPTFVQRNAPNSAVPPNLNGPQQIAMVAG